MTTHERRVLYILRKHGGRAKHMQISQAMSRVPKKDRERALANCETLELVSSAKTPPAKGGGPGGMVYWLTDAGIDYVQGLIDSGDMTDPMLEQRKGRRATG